jgi:hypothetical protein
MMTLLAEGRPWKAAVHRKKEWKMGIAILWQPKSIEIHKNCVEFSERSFVPDRRSE